MSIFASNYLDRHTPLQSAIGLGTNHFWTSHAVFLLARIVSLFAASLPLAVLSPLSLSFRPYVIRSFLRSRAMDPCQEFRTCLRPLSVCRRAESPPYVNEPFLRGRIVHSNIEFLSKAQEYAI